jgi:hypothetical protein
MSEDTLKDINIRTEEDLANALFREEVRGDIEDNAREGTNSGFYKAFDIAASYSGRYHNKCVQDKLFEDDDRQYDVIGAAALAARDGKMDCRHVVATCPNQLTGKPIELRADKFLEAYKASGATFSECPCLASPCEHSTKDAPTEPNQGVEPQDNVSDEQALQELELALQDDSSEDGFCKVSSNVNNLDSKRMVDNAAERLQANLDRLEGCITEQEEFGSLADHLKDETPDVDTALSSSSIPTEEHEAAVAILQARYEKHLAEKTKEIEKHMNEANKLRTLQKTLQQDLTHQKQMTAWAQKHAKHSETKASNIVERIVKQFISV